MLEKVPSFEAIKAKINGYQKEQDKIREFLALKKNSEKHRYTSNLKNLLYFNFDKASEKTSLELEEAKEGFFFGLLFKTEYKQQPVYRKYMSVIESADSYY